jgi:hypothetical protein
MGCKYIAGDPANAFHVGEAIYCGKPVTRPGESWCEAHRSIVYTPIAPVVVKRPIEARQPQAAEPQAQAA